MTYQSLPAVLRSDSDATFTIPLWAAQDTSTCELMAHLYRGLVDQALPPARALAEAQRTLWSAGRPPYQWAGFVLVGDWRPLPPFAP